MSAPYDTPAFRSRFERYVQRGEGCWEWTGARIRDGYGQVALPPAPGVRRPRAYAHRVALEMSLGRPLAPRRFALHHCDNPPCVRPDHLYEGTAKDNSADMYERGRASWRRGCLRPDVTVRRLRDYVGRGGVLLDDVDRDWARTEDAIAGRLEVMRYIGHFPDDAA